MGFSLQFHLMLIAGLSLAAWTSSVPSTWLSGPTSDGQDQTTEINHLTDRSDELANSLANSSFSGTYEIERRSALGNFNDPIGVKPADPTTPLVPIAINPPQLTTGRILSAARGPNSFLHLVPGNSVSPVDADAWFGTDCMFGSDGKRSFIYRAGEATYRSYPLEGKETAASEPVGAFLPRDLALAMGPDGIRSYLGVRKSDLDASSGDFRRTDDLVTFRSGAAGELKVLTQQISAPEYLTRFGPKVVERRMTFSGKHMLPSEVVIKQYGQICLHVSVKWVEISGSNGSGFMPQAFTAERFMPFGRNPNWQMVHMDSVKYLLEPADLRTGNAVNVPEFTSQLPNGLKATKHTRQRVALSSRSFPSDIRFRLPGVGNSTHSLFVTLLELISASLIGVATYRFLKRRRQSGVGKR